MVVLLADFLHSNPRYTKIVATAKRVRAEKLFGDARVSC